MPSDKELTLAVHILREFARGLGKASAKNIRGYLITQYGRYESWFDIFRVCRDLAKENILNETIITNPNGKPEYFYNITVDGYSIISILERDILEKRKKSSYSD